MMDIKEKGEEVMIYTDWSDVRLKPMDFFASSNPTNLILGKIINAIQSWNAPDMKSTYTHAGLILNEAGDIFEAGVRREKEGFLHRNLIRNLFECYSGSKVIVCRSNLVTADIVKNYLTPVVKAYAGQVYSYWRLLFFAYPPIARRLGVKKFGVCSELVSMPFQKSGILDFWMGKSPDNLVDMVRACSECPTPISEQKWSIVIEKDVP